LLTLSGDGNHIPAAVDAYARARAICDDAGSKDALASRLFYEPLATFDIDGSLYPVLAAEIPSLANGGVAKDGKAVTWKLKKNVTWHDGKPFTADDVIFNVEYTLAKSAFCPKANRRNFNSLKKRLSLDAWRVPCRGA